MRNSKNRIVLSVIVLTSYTDRIHIIDQMEWSTSDPALEGVDEKPSQSENGNNYNHIPSRPAPAVLKDILKWYRTLEIIPGGGEHSSGHWEVRSNHAQQSSVLH